MIRSTRITYSLLAAFWLLGFDFTQAEELMEDGTVEAEATVAPEEVADDMQAGPDREDRREYVTMDRSRPEDSVLGKNTGTFLAGFESFRKTYLENHLEVGVRVSHFSLEDTKKQEFDDSGNFVGGFLGSIDRLDEEQDYMPTLYARYNVNPYAGIELGWDRFEVKTGTYFDTSDGNFTYSGLHLLFRGRYPNKTILTPYASIGWSFLSGDVDYNSAWHDSGRRNLYPDDTTAFSIGGGCEIAVARNWSLDFGVRYIKADFDVEYKLAAESTSRGDFNFPLDNLTVQTGISYRF